MHVLSDSEPSRPSSRRAILLAAAFLPVLALLVWQAWRAHWLCDDAFISFRYVRNFVEGHGLVFNKTTPPERVEGYTNFLWVLELSALWKLLGIRPEIGCSILSSIYTAGSIALTAMLALASPFRDRRWLVALGALLLLAASHTWAAWSTSGLETRQFTFFILLAAVCLHGSRGRPGRLLLASLALAAGEYTRPEGLLVFGCCFVWLAFDRIRTRSFRLKELVLLSIPYVLLVGFHFAWRLSYYGDLWPNTYYAKHVRAWPEAGFRYYAMAAIEMGLFVLVPAAIAGTLARLRRGDAIHLLGWAILLPHVAYVVQIGGDHFEWRVLDFYWPFLAVAGVEGILVASDANARPFRARLVGPLAAALLFSVLLAYGSAVQVAKEVLTARLNTRAETQKMKVSIRPEDCPPLFLLPGMSALMRSYAGLSAYLAPRGVAAPYAEHKFVWKQELARFQPFEVLRGIQGLPEDAVTSRGSIGISGYYLADLVIIDAKGLTDRHVARMPVLRPNSERYMAHDRSADWEYLVERGYNLTVLGAEKTWDAALEEANYAMKIRDDLWMPFEPISTAWVEKAFAAGPEVRGWKPERLIGCFAEGDLAGWTCEGDSFASDPTPEQRRRARFHGVRRCPGGFVLDSRASDPSLPATGRALSPPFRVPSLAALELWVGGAGPGAGVRLLRGSEVLDEWRSRDAFRVAPERHDLRAYAGDELRVEVFDESAEGGGYVLVGDVVLLVPGRIGEP